MLHNYLNAIKNNITNIDTYNWDCYGYNVKSFDSYIQGKYECNAVVALPGGELRELTFYDFVKSKAYRWTDPDYKDAHNSEAVSLGVNPNEAWDDVTYCEVEIAEDILEKMTAVNEGRDYDPRITIPVDMTNEEFIQIAKAAHALDITINEFVHRALVEALEHREQWKDWT